MEVVREKDEFEEETHVCDAARRLAWLGRLSLREQEVLGLVASGVGDRLIGEKLHISHRTVRAHISALFVKLGVKSRVEVAATGLLAHIACCDSCARAVLNEEPLVASSSR